MPRRVLQLYSPYSAGRAVLQSKLTSMSSSDVEVMLTAPRAQSRPGSTSRGPSRSQSVQQDDVASAGGSGGSGSALQDSASQHKLASKPSTSAGIIELSDGSDDEPYQSEEEDDEICVLDFKPAAIPQPAPE